MTKQAKIIAMTCTHAALKRHDFLDLGLKYDNLVMEESAQILEIETFIPMLLQRQDDNIARLKRVILIGDHHQVSGCGFRGGSVGDLLSRWTKELGHVTSA